MATDKTPKGKKVKRAVLFKLTATEKAAKGEAAGNVSEEFKALDAKWKVVRSDYGGKLKGFQSKITKLLEEIHQGEERREVECTEVKNFEKNTVEFWHKGKVADTREMTPDDRQSEMKIVAPKKEKWQKAGGKTRYPVSSEEASEQRDIAEVHKLETRRATKKSSVDGPTP